MRATSRRNSLLYVGLVVGTVGPIIAVFNEISTIGLDALWPLSWIAYAPMGFLILWRRRGNGVGAGLMLVGVASGASWVFGSIAGIEALSMDTRVWFELANVVLGVLPWIGVVWLLVVFPSGTYQSSAEVWLGRLLIGFGAYALLAFALGSELMHETGRTSPLAIPEFAAAAAVITDQSGFFIVIALVAAALVLLVRRWRAGTGVERAQFRWLFFGAFLFLSAMTAGQFLPDGAGGPFLWILAGMAIPSTIGVAVLRYRLFEIDRIVSRTIAYTTVVALLGAAVVIVVSGFARFIPSDDPLVVAVATLVAFILFNPLRRRVQRIADRHFNRSRYDAERIITAFSGSLQSRVDAQEVLDGWVDVVSDTLQPATAGVWVRS